MRPQQLTVDCAVGAWLSVAKAGKAILVEGRRDPLDGGGKGREGDGNRLRLPTRNIQAEWTQNGGCERLLYTLPRDEGYTRGSLGCR